jgi:hypothetical protein
LTSIGDYAFSDCTGLTSLTIPNSVTIIGDDAFSDCTGLTSLMIPNSVTSIGGYAFSDCTGLTSVTIPNSVTSIGDWAFYGCSSLTNLTIGSGLTNIGFGAFIRCTSLTDVLFLGLPPPNPPSYLGSSATIYCLPQYSASWPSTFAGLSTAAFSLSPKIDGSPRKNSSGFYFKWTGSANIPMNVQRTTSLAGGTWSNVAAGITSGEFTDPNPPVGAAFYRAVVP